MVTRSTYQPPPAWDKPLVRVDSVTSLASSSSECSFEMDEDCENLPFIRGLAESYQAMTNPSLNESLLSLESTTDRSTSTTSSSGITFYQSSFRFNFMDRDTDVPSTTHGIPNQQSLPRPPNRGIDRNISLPRERHVASDLSLCAFTRDITNTPRSVARSISQNISGHSSASKPLSTISNHNNNQSSSTCVSPEVTRPTTQRNPSSSYASPMPTTSTHRLPLSRYPSSSTPTAAAAAPMRSTPPSSLRVPSLRCNDSGPARITPVPTPTSEAPANASPPPPPRDKVLLEIAPGIQLRLRGAEETHGAVAQGFYVQCECFLCATTGNDDALYCILDCDYFLCPDCRSVYPNPMSEHSLQSLPEGSSAQFPGGLGLGFRMDETSPSGERVTR